MIVQTDDKIEKLLDGWQPGENVDRDAQVEVALRVVNGLLDNALLTLEQTALWLDQTNLYPTSSAALSSTSSSLRNLRDKVMG